MLNKRVLKSVVIGMLFLSSIVLTSRIMIKMNSLNAQQKVEKDRWLSTSIKIEQFLNPQGYVINFGGGLHTKVYDLEKYDLVQEQIINILEEYLYHSDFRQINYVVWEDAYFKRGIQIKLPYEMRLSHFSAFVGLGNHLKFNFNVDEIMILSEGEILFKSNNNYYKIDQVKELSQVNEIINSFEKGNVTEYKRIEDIYKLSSHLSYSKFKENNVLKPITKVDSLPIINVSREFDISDDQDNFSVKSYASKILGDDFRFIRKVRNYDDSIIYMLGYGEKSLKIDNRGSLDYREKIDYSTTESLSFKEGLERSINVLKTIGKLPDMLYLSNYSTFEREFEEEKIMIHRYEFNYKVKGYDVVVDQKLEAPFIVELNGSQVVRVKRQKLNIVKDLATYEIWEDTIDILEALSIPQNTALILRNYNKSNLGEDIVGYHLLQDIEKIQLTYYLSYSDQEYNLVPCWLIKIDKHTYFINIYTGDILNTVEEEISNELE